MTKRLGLIFRPAGVGFQKSHGQNPFVEQLSGNSVRVHFACRDDANRSRGMCLDTTWENLISGRLIAEEVRLTLDVGPLGAFDDTGAMPHSIVQLGERRFLYYTGWSLAVTVPFSFHIGLAVSSDGGQSFERVSQAPIIGRTRHDPYIVGAPFVLHDEGMFRMWYTSCTKWVEGTPPIHEYTVKHAWSDDGIDWRTSPDLCLDYGEGVYANARPVVFRRDRGDYLMFYSHRGVDTSYRIGVAQSSDGLDWKPITDDLLECSCSGWDSEMTCYAWPIRYGDEEYFLYNGNRYGIDGFGLVQKQFSDL